MPTIPPRNPQHIPSASPGVTVARLQRLAADLKPLAATPLAREFLDATRSLPWIQPRTLSQDAATKAIYTAATKNALPVDQQRGLLRREFNEHEYYEGRYGLPLAFFTLIDMLPPIGFQSLAGARILEIGFGSVLSLRLMASLGAHVTGTESDRLPLALYAGPADQGPVRTRSSRSGGGGGGGAGAVQDGAVVIRAAPPMVPLPAPNEAFDLVLSRNTLKRGYVQPAADGPLAHRVDLGMPAGDLLRRVRDSMRPGGVFVISNWFGRHDVGPGADARCPFSPAEFTQAGFEVLSHDAPNDDLALRLVHAVNHSSASGIDASAPILAMGVLSTVARAAP
jgi:SAM-dependent methyltransferase